MARKLKRARVHCKAHLRTQTRRPRTPTSHHHHRPFPTHMHLAPYHPPHLPAPQPRCTLPDTPAARAPRPEQGFRVCAERRRRCQPTTCSDPAKELGAGAHGEARAWMDLASNQGTQNSGIQGGIEAGVASFLNAQHGRIQRVQGLQRRCTRRRNS